MICSSLCRVPFMAVLLSWVWENSHSRRSSFRGLRHNDASEEVVEKILQIRHLYSHRNGIIDEKFQGYFPNAKLNEEHRMTLDEFLEKFELLGADNKRA
jgi:hypothetical protein